MLQYLTDDLLSGYGLPKKRMSVSDQMGNYYAWSLVGRGIGYDNYIIYRQLTDTIDIGRDMIGLLCSLHSNGVTRVVGEYTRPSQAMDMRDLHRYLDD
jgi:hypothetical protein